MIAASRLQGVLRIALPGSRGSPKPDPEDVDLLVTVSHAADLAALAKVARRLKGRGQALNRGADSFVSDPTNTYMGRICQWRRCGPGIRASCDALNCGRRIYLHDDTETVRLPKSLVANPPVELWPDVLAREPVPADVTERLTARLPSRAEAVSPSP